MLITKIAPQKNNHNFFNVFIDGDFCCSLSQKVIASNNLLEGQQIIESQVNLLKQNSFVGQILARVIRFLGIRNRSEWEIREYLKKIFKKGDLELTNTSLEDEIVNKIKLMNLIDDTKFAKEWIESRKRFKVRGNALIKQELKAKGISEKTINTILINDESNEELPSQLELAKKLLIKKIGNKKIVKNSELWKEKGKLQNYLFSKGFSFSTARQAVEEAGIKE